MTDPLATHVQQLLAPEYEIHQELGRGGMAVVYEATHRQQNRRVAIKVLPPQRAFDQDLRERFVREARAAAALDHPGIVPVYSAAVTGDIAWYVMALVQGDSLARRLTRLGQLPTDEARWILAEIADALDYAHRSGLVHRDVKPDNILLDETTGRPMLTDFGIARAMDDDHRITQDGDAIGTPNYMSPEQALGLLHIDARADIYSLGVVGYQMLTGAVPFTASSMPALLTMHVSQRAVPLLDRRPDTPLAIAEAIGRAMEKKPNDRWPSMSAFRTALGAAPAPPRRAARIAVAGPSPAPEPTRSIRERVAHFRLELVESAVLALLLAIMNVASAPLDRFDFGYFVYSPDFTLLAIVGTLLVLNIILQGVKLYADNVRVKELLFGLADSGRPSLPSEAAVARPATRYEATRSRAAQEHREINEIMAELSPEKRALVGAVVPSALALHNLVEKMTGDLRELDGPLDVEKDVTGSVFLRLDSAVDAMRALKLGLRELNDTGFVTGVEQLNATAERARVLAR